MQHCSKIFLRVVNVRRARLRHRQSTGITVSEQRKVQLPQKLDGKNRDAEAVIFRPLPYLSLPLPPTKNKKTTVDNFFNFFDSIACLLLHFIILRGQNLHLLQLLYLLRSSLWFRTTLCFFYLDIRSRVECRTVLSFDRVTSSDLLPLNDFDISTLFHRSYPDISFALFSLALSCSWEVLQNLCSNHLPILLTVPLSPVFRSNERLPSLNFRKACQDDFAFYFHSHCPSAEEYSSLFLSFAAALFTSLILNALLTIWCSGQTTLFLSLLAKTALACLPTALSMTSRPPFPSQQAQYAQVFPLKPAPFCTLFAGLGSTNKSAISLFFSSYLTLALSSPPCSLLHLSLHLNLCQKLFSLFYISIRLQWVPGHSFLPDDDAADELARREALLVPSAIPCSHSSLISGIYSSLFSDWRRTVSSKFFDSQVQSISTEELVLLCHARCVLSRLRCNGHSLL